MKYSKSKTITNIMTFPLISWSGSLEYLKYESSDPTITPNIPSRPKLDVDIRNGAVGATSTRQSH